MAFLESPRLDVRITQGARATVRTKRTKVYTASGKLSQDFRWSILKHELDVAHGLRSRDDYQTLLDLFYVVMGGAYQGFRVRYEPDYQGTQENTAATLISGGDWQLQRKHTAGEASYLHPISKPISPVIVYRSRGGGPFTVVSDTVDYTTGIAAISGHVDGDVYAWEGEFDLPMTFVDDEWVGDLEVTSADLHVMSQRIMLEELKL